jgi:hypothetical protein
MMSHTILYIDEMRKGNYKIFLEHVFSQLPTHFAGTKSMRKY